MFSIFSLLKMIMLSRTLYVAADLNIADHLAERAMTVEELAYVTHTDVDALQRMMYFLKLNDVFKQENDATYSLTDFSHTMCTAHPYSIKSLLLHDNEKRWNSIGHLKHSIVTGNASYDMLYGTDYFSSLKSEPVASSRFNEAMHMISAQENHTIATQLTFNNIVADIGGSTGDLLNQITTHTNNLRGILFDLPEVVAQAPTLNSSCVVCAGSFFEPLPFTADVFILKRIA